jgi:hypothetical protein
MAQEIYKEYASGKLSYDEYIAKATSFYEKPARSYYRASSSMLDVADTLGKTAEHYEAQRETAATNIIDQVRAEVQSIDNIIKEKTEVVVEKAEMSVQTFAMNPLQVLLQILDELEPFTEMIGGDPDLEAINPAAGLAKGDPKDFPVGYKRDGWTIGTVTKFSLESHTTQRCGRKNI